MELEYSHAHSFMDCLWLLFSIMAELSSGDRGCIAHEAQNVNSIDLRRESLLIPLLKNQ